MEATRPPPPKKYESCVFCGGLPLTQTHIWPNWLKKSLPLQRSFNTVGHRATGLHKDTTGRIASIQKSKTDLFAQQPYLACYQCNGGWMKNFEDDVVRFVKPIISGTFRGRLAKDFQNSLSGWIALIVVLAELNTFANKTISKADIDHLRQHSVPPDNWTLAIAHAEGPIWNKHYQYHNHVVYSQGESVPLKADGLPMFNTSFSSMGIGSLFVQAFCCPKPSAVEDYRDELAQTGLTQLWPTKSLRRIKFPLSMSLTDKDASIFALGGHGHFRKIFQ